MAAPASAAAAMARDNNTDFNDDSTLLCHTNLPRFSFKLVYNLKSLLEWNVVSIPGTITMKSAGTHT